MAPSESVDRQLSLREFAEIEGLDNPDSKMDEKSKYWGLTPSMLWGFNSPLELLIVLYVFLSAELDELSLGWPSPLDFPLFVGCLLLALSLLLGSPLFLDLSEFFAPLLFAESSQFSACLFFRLLPFPKLCRFDLQRQLEQI